MNNLFELLNSIGLILFSFLKEVTDEEIEKNTEFLKRYEWFQELLQNNKYQKLIIENEDVRLIIGKINCNKMHRVSYQKKWKIKIEHSLVKY